MCSPRYSLTHEPQRTTYIRNQKILLTHKNTNPVILLDFKYISQTGNLLIS